MENIKNNIKKFIYSDYYLALTAAIAFLAWAFNISAAGSITLIILGSAALFFADDISPVLPAVLLQTIMMRTNDINAIIPYWPYYICTVPLIIVSLTLFFIKQIKQRGRPVTGKQMIWLLTAAAGMILSCIFCSAESKEYKYLSVLFAAGYFAAIIIFYFLSLNYIDKERKRYIAKLFLYAAAAVMAEMLFYYLSVPDVNHAFRYKTIHLGWGISNNISVYLIIAVPMILYLAVDSKYAWIYTLVSLIACAGIVFTLSRGCILFAAIVFPFMYIYALIKTSRKKSIIITFAGFTVTVITIMLIFRYGVWELFSGMIEKGFSDSGRIDLYALALKIFRENPFFGIGFFGGALDRTDAHNMLMAHCTPLQLLMSVGIAGTLCCVMMYFCRFFCFFRKCNLFKLFAFVSVLVFELYGLMDITFYNIDLLMFLYILIGFSEKTDEKDDISTEFINRAENKIILKLSAGNKFKRKTVKDKSAE